MKRNKNLKKSRKVQVGDDFDEKIKKPKSFKENLKYRHKNYWLEEDDLDDLSSYKLEEE